MGNASFPFLTVLVLLPAAGAAVVAVVPPRVVPSWFYQYAGAMVALGTLARGGGRRRSSSRPATAATSWSPTTPGPTSWASTGRSASTASPCSWC